MTMTRMLAAALAAAFALAAGPACADIKTEWVDYTHGDVKLKGYLAYDDAITGKRPAVLMIHDRAGMTAVHAQARRDVTPSSVTSASSLTFFGYGQGVLPKDVPGNARRRRRSTPRTAH